MTEALITRSGYVAIIGRPNVGKSTLLNQLVGQKLSIISRKPQTTRRQILGAVTMGDAQAAYIDTPGIHEVEKRVMGRYMNRLANAVIEDADIIVVMIEAKGLRKEDEIIFKKCLKGEKPVILVINKIDALKNKNQLLSLIKTLEGQYDFSQIVPMSARKKADVQRLQKIIFQLLPAGGPLFPEGQITDQSLSFQIAEWIREKIIRATGQELPYSTAVSIESMENKKKIMHIHAIIWVERESQKPIVIGKNGESLKRIGTAARKDIEQRLGQKVFLKLWVKVKADWTQNERFLEQHL